MGLTLSLAKTKKKADSGSVERIRRQPSTLIPIFGTPKKDAKAKSGAEKSQKPDKSRQSKRKKPKTKFAADDGKVLSRDEAHEGGTHSNGSSSE